MGQKCVTNDAFVLPMCYHLIFHKLPILFIKVSYIIENELVVVFFEW